MDVKNLITFTESPVPSGTVGGTNPNPRTDSSSKSKLRWGNSSSLLLLEGDLLLITLPGEVVRVDESITPVLHLYVVLLKLGTHLYDKSLRHTSSGVIHDVGRVVRPLRVTETEGVTPVSTPFLGSYTTMTCYCHGFSGCSTTI